MKLDIRLLKQALTARAALAGTILLGLLGGFFIVVQARLLSRIVTAVFLQGATLAALQGSLTAFLVVVIVRVLVVFGAEVSAGEVSIRVRENIRETLAKHLLALGPAGTGSQHSAELTGLVTDGVDALEAYFSQFLPQIVLAAGVPIIILLSVFPLDRLTGLIFILTAPLIPVFMILIGGASETATRRQWAALSRLSAYFLDTIQGLVTLKMINRSRDQAGRIEAAAERYRQATLSVLRVTFLSAFALEFIATLSTAIVAVQIGLRLLYGQMEFEQAFFILIVAPEFYLPLRQLGTRFHAAANGMAAAGKIFEFLDKKPPLIETFSPVQPALVLDRPFRITFQEVSYGYPDRPEDTLHRISFNLHSGQFVALVGPSGAGKTTLARLLLRFMDPQGGEITVNGTRLVDIAPDAWRRQIAWVPQAPYLRNGSLAANLRLAKPDASESEMAVAAKMAHLEDWIESLPDRYQTPIGERGARISGGQAQRLALARAFLKNAPLVVMDEPTAHLDPIQDALLGDTIEGLRRDRTVLMIAHRLSSVVHADAILVMENGQIIETGTHETLRNAGGLYTRLYQASGGGEL
jgi:ATP-binding cassette subfamily C protein CydD